MKYAAIAVALLLAAFAISTMTGGTAADDGHGDAAVKDDAPPAGEAPLSSTAFKDEFQAAPPGSLTPFDDPIPDEIFRMITDLVAGKVTDADRQSLQARLVTAMEEAELGNAILRDGAARVAVDDLLKNARIFSPAGGQSSPAYQERQQEMIRTVAASFAARLIRQVPGMLIAAEHTGSFLVPVREIKLPDGFEEVSWALLSSFEYEEFAPIPPAIKAKNGKLVGLTGYMITLQEMESIHEFLLVESVWTCCFGVAPDVHQVVVVNKEGSGIEYTTEPLLLLGTLEVGEDTEDGFVTSIYRLKATVVRELK